MPKPNERDEVLKRMLKTPPKKHELLKGSKVSRGESKDGPKGGENELGSRNKDGQPARRKD